MREIIISLFVVSLIIFCIILIYKVEKWYGYNVKYSNMVQKQINNVMKEHIKEYHGVKP